MPHFNFDPSRAHLSTEDLFKPFAVEKTIALKDAMNSKRVKPDTELLLLNHPDTPIALIKLDMAYHHVAQGEIAGEPWLVSF